MDFLSRAFEKISNKDLGEIQSVEDQPQDQIQLAGFVKSKVQEVRQASSRVSHEGTWMTNYAYLLGYDSVYYDTNTRQFRAVGLPNRQLRRNRVHVNKVLPTVQRRQARLCKNAPRFEVKPDNATTQAKDKARLEKQVLDMYFDKERVQEKRLHMMPGLMQCGHYYMGVDWDDQKGEMIPSPMGDIEYEGDINISLLSPFEIFPDPLGQTLEECAWIIRAKVRKLDYFKTHWPDRGNLVKEEDAWLLSLQYEMRLQSMTGQGPATSGVQNQMKSCAIELTYYEKRSKKHPNGRMVVVANGVLLHDGQLPVGEIPIVKFDDIPITGKFYSEAIVTHLRPIQDQYNKLISRRADWTNRLLAGKYIAAKGSQLAQEALNDQSGEVLYYNPVPNGMAPQAMPIPVIPQYAYTEEDKLNQMFYDIAGEGDVSRGVLPSSSIPAIGMQLLLEQDETRVQAITEQHEHAFARLGALILKYAEAFITNERLLKIADPNADYIIKKFSGSDLKSAHDVIVIRGSLAPASTAVKRNDILNLFNMGLLGDPANPETRSKVVQMLEFGETTGIWSQQSIDMAQVKKTIEMIESGIVPEIHEMDNHPLHIQEKNNYRKSDRFGSLDATKQAILLNDIEEHVKALMKLTAPQFGMTPTADDEISMRTESIQAQQIASGLTSPEEMAAMGSFEQPIDEI